MTYKPEQEEQEIQQAPVPELPPNPNLMREYNPAKLRHIVVAGGNFWGIEAFMARVPGVAKAESGYANGVGKNMTLQKVLHGSSDYALAVRVSYDPSVLSLGKLLDLFFGIIDPTTLNNQGLDWGTAYRSGVYYEDRQDYAEIEAAFMRQRERYESRIMSEFEPLRNFVKAEPAQQQYLEKNPGAYNPVSFSSLPSYMEVDN